jgi:hypothetical protein
MTAAGDIYRLQKRNQATMRQVTNLLADESERVISVAANLEQQDLGGFLRATVPGLIDRYGKVNAAAAMKYYDEQRLTKLSKLSPYAGRSAVKNARRSAERLAKAKLLSEVYVAKVPTFNAIAKSQTIVNYGMALFQGPGFESMRSEVINAMTRAVAGYNRDTLLYNSALDEAVVGVQRVAEPNACDFCQTVAFDSYGGVRTTDYAVAWHNNCHCSIETIYEGSLPTRPDYYDSFEYGSTNAEPALSKDWTSFKKEFSADYVSA